MKYLNSEELVHNIDELRNVLDRARQIKDSMRVQRLQLLTEAIVYWQDQLDMVRKRQKAA